MEVFVCLIWLLVVYMNNLSIYTTNNQIETKTLFR